MTRHYFAGANQSQWARVLKGQDILISYADISTRPGWWTQHMLPALRAGAYGSVMLDSGAFTELSNPRYHTDLAEFGAFVAAHRELFDVVVTLDDIRGDLQTTWQNTAHLEGLGLDVMPVFHGREPWGVLRAYVAKYHQVGLGFAREVVGSRAAISKDQGDGLGPDAWLAKALDICEAAGVEVHGLGMTDFARRRGHTRLASTDSTTWIAEYRAMKKPEVDSTLSRTVAAMHADDIARLAVRSYRAAPPIQDASDAAWIEGAAKGQARTVYRRYGAKALLQTLRDLTGLHVIIERRAA